MKSNRQSAPRYQDPEYLLKQQYQSSTNLEARISLHRDYSVNPVGLHRWLLEKAVNKLPGAGELLEIGCGPGSLWANNADMVPNEWRLTLTDFSPGMVAACEENLVGKYSQRKMFKVVDAQAIPYADNQFDAVFAHFMLYHVPDRAAAFQEIKRVLKPNGYFFAATFGKRHLRKINEMAMQLEGSGPDSWDREFRLDDGALSLAAFFDDVQRYDYKDQLVITDAAPLVEYVRSMVKTSEVAEPELTKLQREIEDTLHREGRIVVEKESGVFICQYKVKS